MKLYSNKLSLNYNSRGVYILDTVMGCNSGMKEGINGCYDDCYAAKSAKIYGYDFSKNVDRIIYDNQHKQKIISDLQRIEMPFVRIGGSGDPSENWEHTMCVIKEIQPGIKRLQLDLFKTVKSLDVVIITKHWTELPEKYLNILAGLGVVFNTSISAIDKPKVLAYRISQHNRLKQYTKAFLRVVTFDFSGTPEGMKYKAVQDEICKNANYIDTVFRTSKSNPLVMNGIIKIKKGKFLGSPALISKMNKKTYFGKCGSCLEMCGSKMNY